MEDFLLTFGTKKLLQNVCFSLDIFTTLINIRKLDFNHDNSLFSISLLNDEVMKDNIFFVFATYSLLVSAVLIIRTK